EPDSPTIAVVVPRRIAKETSSTAVNGVVLHVTVPRIGNSLVRFWTSITASGSEGAYPNSGACASAGASGAAAVLGELVTACARVSARAAAETRRREASEGAARMRRLVYGCCGFCSS